MIRVTKILIVTATAIVGAACFGVTTYASPITYNYLGTVTNCPFGDPAGPCGTPGSPGPITTDSIITGFMLIDETAVSTGAAGAGDIQDFLFDVGGVFALTPAVQTVNAATNILFDAAGQVSGGSFALNLPGLAGPGADGLLLDTYGPGGAGSWEITIPLFGGAFINGGNSQLTRIAEPSSFLLVGLGLAGIVWLRRKRRADGPLARHT